MKISTQLVAGYLLAVAATLAVGVLSHFQLRAAGRDLDEVVEEWREMDTIARALSALHGNARGELVRYAARLARMARAAGDGEHERKEAAMLAELSRLMRRASRAEGEDLERIVDRARSVAGSFWEEDAERLPQRVAEIARHKRRLSEVNVVLGLGIILLPLLFLAHLHFKIARPLAAMQRRVEAIGELQPDAHQGSAGMTRLGAAIERMAAAVAERRKGLEAEVETRTLQLQHADRLGGLGRIAAAVAHEINTPLASIGLCLDGIREAARDRTGDAGDLDTYVRTAKEQIGCCTETTRKLLSYAHVRSPGSRAVTAGSLVGEAADLVASHLQRSGVEVAVEDRAPGACVRGDVAQLRQVIVNLFLNAIDVSPRSESVVVGIDAGNGQVAIRVRDGGPGIPAELREEVFSPFFTTKRPGEGTGLGLSIAREIAETHGGDLALGPDQPARGATFLLRLPLAGKEEA